MRFHIGFSKRISIKKLIEFIGFLFVAILTFFGIYETTHAEEVTWTSLNNQANNITPYKYDYLDYYDNFSYQSRSILGVYRNNGLVVVSYNNSSNSSNWYRFTYAFSDKARTTLPEYNGYIYTSDEIFQALYYKFEPTSSICQNNTTSLKSVNFQITLSNTLDYSNINVFNQNFVDYDQFTPIYQGVRMLAHTTIDNEDSYFSTTCTFNKTYNNSYAVYDCNNVFQGNTSYPVDYYLIQINNNLPFNDLYSSSTSINAYISSNNGFYAPISSNDNTPFRYSCSDDAPVLNEPLPSEDDPAGLNDIYDRIKGLYDDNISGIDIISSPNSYLELINLPFALFRALIDSNDNVCSPYEIDLSSIMTRWGDPNSSYTLRLPCMRDTLSNTLGSDLYNTLDLLICFYLVYQIMMFIVRSISAILSGEDLFDFYFGGKFKNDKE